MRWPSNDQRPRKRPQTFARYPQTGRGRIAFVVAGQARSLLWRHWVVLREMADARDAQPFGPRLSVGFGAGRAPIRKTPLRSNHAHRDDVRRRARPIRGIDLPRQVAANMSSMRRSACARRRLWRGPETLAESLACHLPRLRRAPLRHERAPRRPRDLARHQPLRSPMTGSNV